jgi:hypothetical protein
MRFLNEVENDAAPVDHWVIPRKGSFLYMIGKGDGTYTVEAETLK